MRSRQNGGVIGVPNSSTVSSTQGVWSISEINTLENTPNQQPTTTVRYTIPTTWPNSSNVAANIDLFASQKVYHIPDLDFTDWVQKDQSSKAWHEYMVADQTYRGTLTTAFGPAYQDWCTHFHEDAYYSIYDGTQFLFATGQFTIEFWAKLQRQDGTRYWIMGRNNTAGATAGTGWGVFVSPTYQVGFFDAIANTSITSTATLNRDQWYHIAMTRANTSSNGFSIWIDGSLDTSATLASDYQNVANLIIGRDGVATSTTFYGGRLTDIRVSNVAMYTTTFSVPTANLVMYGNTTRYGHSSTNPGHGTIGNAQPQGRRVSYFGTPARLIDSPYINESTMLAGPGYNSMYGYGTEGGFKIYDTNPSDTSLRFGTGPFTVEAWIYLSSVGATGTASGLIGKGNFSPVGNGAGSGWNFYISNNNLVWNDTATSLLASVNSPTVTIGKCGWHHVAAVRAGTGANQFSMYIDGSLVYVGTLSTNYNQTDALRIMNTRGLDYYFRGYVSGLRISNVAVYTTSTFDATPSTLIPKSIKEFSANTTLLVGAQSNSDMARGFRQGWMDRGKTRLPVKFRNTETRHGPFHPAPRGATGKDQFGMYFTGTANDSLAAITTTNDWDFGTGDFSIEVWVMAKYVYTTSAYSYILDSRRYFSDNGIAIRIGTTTQGIDVYTGNQMILSNNKIPCDIRTWVHLVVQRVSGAIALYANGYKVAETMYTGSIVSTDSRLIIGNSVYPNLQYGNMFNGWLSDIRIIKGATGYAVNGVNPDRIAVPTEPVPVTPETVLSSLNSPVVRDLSSKNNYIYWNTSQYSSGSWDFYICNQSPYAPLPPGRDNSIVGDTWDQNSGWYQGDGPYTSDSTRPEYSFITRMSKAWTVEGWFYCHQNSTSAPATVVDSARTANTTGHEGFALRMAYANGAASYNNVSFALYTAHNSTVQYFYTTYTYQNTVLKSHSWNHVAVQYDPTKTAKMAIFINGVRAITGAAFNPGTKIWNTSQLQINQAGSAGVRISDTARYDNDATTYTVPTQNFEYDQYTVSHYDAGRTCVWGEFGRKSGFYSYGTPYPSTEFKKYGTGSLRFNSRDTATIVDRVVFGASYWHSRPFDLDKQDWTFECWASWWDAASGGVAISASGSSLWNHSNYLMIKVSSTGYWQLIRGSTTTVYQTLTTNVQVATRSAGTWDHICLVRRAGTYFFYVNGVEKGNLFGNHTGTYANLTVGPTTNIDDSFASSSLDSRLGSDYQATANMWNGYVQDARWTYTARYTTKVINGVATMVHVTTLLPALPTSIHPR